MQLNLGREELGWVDFGGEVVNPVNLMCIMFDLVFDLGKGILVLAVCF